MATETADVEQRDEFQAKEAIIGAYIGQMKELQIKYANYSTTGKSDNDETLRNLVFTFFSKTSIYFDAMDKYGSCVKDPTCKDYYVNDFRNSLLMSTDIIQSNYEKFVEGNNRN